jgi:hypothetical protein
MSPFWDFGSSGALRFSRFKTTTIYSKLIPNLKECQMRLKEIYQELKPI